MVSYHIVAHVPVERLMNVNLELYNCTNKKLVNWLTCQRRIGLTHIYKYKCFNLKLYIERQTFSRPQQTIISAKCFTYVTAAKIKEFQIRHCWKAYVLIEYFSPKITFSFVVLIQNLQKRVYDYDVRNNVNWYQKFELQLFLIRTNNYIIQSH